MSPRTGRPKKDNPISIRTGVRLDKITNEKLIAYCEKNDIRKGEVIRKAIILFLENNK